MNKFALQPLSSSLFIFIFSSKLVATTVLFLVASLLLQPIDMVFAQEMNDNILLETEITPSNIITNMELENDKKLDGEVEKNIATKEEEKEYINTIDSDENKDENSVNEEILSHDLKSSDNIEFQEEQQILNSKSQTEIQTKITSPATSTDAIDDSLEEKSKITNNQETIVLLNSSTTSDDASNTSKIINPNKSIESSQNYNIVNSSSSSSSISPLVGSQGSTTDQIDSYNENNEETNNQSNNNSQDTGSDLKITSVTDSNKSTTSEIIATSSTTNTIIKDEPSIQINDQNRYQFSKQDCVEVGEGAYYCSETNQKKVYQDDGVYALPDATGDMEIFVSVNGKTHQLTDNFIDDSSPYFDPLSNRVVWQTQHNDRYQIASYSFDDKETIILTNDNHNNMEPVAYGNITLWQAWIDNNWEIMMHDGDKTVRLTDNDMHDIAPHIRGGYIVWQTQFSDGWKVAVYDTDTKSIEYIDGLDNFGVAENPRFVLVFDQVNGNGDVQTIGYDFNTKSTIHLGSLPQEVPTELPEPEQTGETRALIQTKPSGRDIKEKINDGNNTKISDDDNLINVNTATTTESSTSTVEDLIVQPYQPQSATTTNKTVVTEEVLTEMSIASSTEPTIHIPDVVIPPITGSSTESAG